jgi:hypothetical protein
MQRNGVDHVISDMCMFLRREIFNAQERFFDKNDTLTEFPQLYNYERFDLWTVISIDILENNVNIGDPCCEYCILTDVVNIIVNKLFDYWISRCCECELWIPVMLCGYSCECFVYILLWILNLKNIQVS